MAAATNANDINSHVYLPLLRRAEIVNSRIAVCVAARHKSPQVRRVCEIGKGGSEMNLEEQYHAEDMLRKIERVEAERDNAWTELREIRVAISANPEEYTLDEVVKLRQQLAEARAEVEQAFREGFRSPATYNDVLVNCEDDEWENYKRGMK